MICASSSALTFDGPPGPKKVDLHEAARFLFGSSSAAKTVEPTSAEVYSFRFRGDAQTKALLDRARDLLGPTRPSQLSDVMALALEALIDKLERQKRSKVNRPGKPHKEATPGDRYVSPQTRREVFTRDSDRCTCVSPAGLRCGCTFGLELDHVIPIARGGKSTRDNLRVRCRAHNLLAADETFGTQKMARYTTPLGPAKAGSASKVREPKWRYAANEARATQRAC